MKLIVVHDSKGSIVSVARAELDGRGKLQAAAGLRAGRGQTVLEFDVASELGHKPLSEIHEAYRVDVKAKKLVARPGKQSPKRPG